MPWAGLQKLRAWQVSVEDSHFERPVMTPQYPRLEWPCVHNRLQVETSGDGIFHFEMIEPLSGILGREHDTSRKGSGLCPDISLPHALQLHPNSYLRHCDFSGTVTE